MLLEFHADHNAISLASGTPLHATIAGNPSSRKIEIIEKLLLKGADSTVFSSSALDSIRVRGETNIVDMLIELNLSSALSNDAGHWTRF